MKKWHLIPAIAALAVSLPGATLAHAAQPHVAAIHAAHTTTRTIATVRLHSGLRLTLALPANVKVTGVGPGVTLGVAPAGSGPASGGGVQPFTTESPSGPAGGVAKVNTYVQFSYTWSNGPLCCLVSWSAQFVNESTNQGPYDFDDYQCNGNCGTGSHGFSHQFGTPNIHWRWYVHETNAGDSTYIRFTTTT